MIGKLASMLGKLRYISIIAVISAGLSSVLMFVIGAVKTYTAYAVFLDYSSSQNTSVASKQAIAFLVQGIDAFLIALVFLIFSGGVYNLFIRRDGDNVQIRIVSARYRQHCAAQEHYR